MKETLDSTAEISKAADGVAVPVKLEQYANKWKKLEDKFKKTGNTTKKLTKKGKNEFYDELTDSTDRCKRYSPNIYFFVFILSLDFLRCAYA